MKTIVEIILCFIIFKYSFAQSRYAQCAADEKCIPHKECPDVQKLTSKGFLTHEERDYLSRKQCAVSNRMALICCKDSSKNNIHGSRIQTDEIDLPEPTVCGGDPFKERILGGIPADIDDYPWHALIKFEKKSNGVLEYGYDCGGSLINNRFVITAAHCEKRVPKTWKITHVRLGEWDMRTNPDCQNFGTENVCNFPYLEIPVETIIVHENYNPRDKNQINDIALLKLQNDVQYNKFISPICLPIAQNLRDIDYSGHELEVTGFGRTENATASLTKMKLKLDATSLESCQNTYQRGGIRFANSQMCAGGEKNQDSCKGDSGGPLMKFQVYPNVNTPYYMLVGLVSFGPFPCGRENYPGVYTRVSEHMDWIIKNIK